MTPQENPESLPQGTEKRKRQREKLAVKVPRKKNFVRKILGNDKAVKESSFWRRMPTLITKARQLQQLCDVSVGVVIQAPDGSFHAWPENVENLKELIMSYKGLDKRRKKETKLLKFLEEKKKKLEKRKEKAVKEKVEQLVAGMSVWLDGLSGDSLVDSVKLLDEKVVELKEKIARVMVGGADNGDYKIMINGGPSSSSSPAGMVFGNKRSFPDVGVNHFSAQHTYGDEMPLPISDSSNNGDSSNLFYPGFGAQNNINDAGLMEEMLNGNDMLTPNPSKIHVSPLHEGLPNSVWSPWF